MHLMAEEEIGARLSLKDRAKFSREAQAAARDVDRVGDAGKSSSKKMKVAGPLMLGVMGAVAGGAVGLAAAAKDAWRQVDDATDAIRVGTGATGAALDSLVGSAHNVAGSVPAAYGDVATAVADLNTRLGVTGKPLEELSTQFLELSRITGTDVAGNVASMTRVFGDWGISADQQASAMDKIFRAAQSTGIGVDALSQQVVQFGAPLRQMGFSFEESLAMFGKWEKEGVNANLVMGGMRQALGKLAKSGEDAPAAFRRITSEIQKMEDPTAATGKAMELFGARSGPDMAAAIREGRFAIDETLAAIVDGQDTIIGAGAETQDFSERWLMFKNRMVPGLAEIGDGALTAAEGIFDFGSNLTKTEGYDTVMGALADAYDITKTAVMALVDAGQDVNAFFQEHDTLARNLAIGLTVLLLPSMIRTVVGWARMGVAAVISAARQAGAWILMQIRSLAYAGVMAVVAALTVAQWIRMGVVAVAQGARMILQWVLMGVRAVAAGAIMAVQAALIVGKWILMGAVAMASGLMMAAAWLLGLGPIGLAIAALIAIGAVFVILWKKSETFRNIVKGALSAVGNAAVAAKDWIVNAFNGVVTFFTTLPGKISSATSGMWDGIKNAFKSAINWLIDKWNGLSLGIPEIDTKIPGIGKIGGFSLDTPNIPRLHTGGTVARGGAVNMLPGEEIVILPPAATVVPMSDDVRSMAAEVAGNSGGSRQPIVLQVVLDRKVLAEAVYDHTGDKVART